MNFQSLESLSLYKEILNNASDGIIIYDSIGIILWCNNQALNILSESKESLVGQNIKNHLPSFVYDNKATQSFDIDLKGQPSQNYKIKKVIITDKKPCRLEIIYIKEVKIFKHLQNNNSSNSSIDLKNSMVTYKSLKFDFDDIVGQNKQLCDVKILAKRAASTNSSILIYGKTGTGKELFAQSIHNASKRSNSQFLAINCAAVPESLLEAIFFGTTKGAYTGAVDRPGLFELASDGTLFLDEINSMPLHIQSKLLRVVQEGTLRRVGGKKDIFINPRIISSTNVEPFKAIENKLLLSDLFYRLGVVCINIPSLQERKDDIPILADYFTKKICDKLERKYVKLSEDVLNFFKQYSWPGNIRQLEHVIESAIVLLKDNEQEVLLEHLPEYIRSISVSSPPYKCKNKNKKSVTSLKHEVNKAERNKIIAELEISKGNISQAARNLQISRQSLYYKMKKYNINISN